MLPRANRIIFEQCAGEALATFGYPLERRPSTLASRLRACTSRRWRGTDKAGHRAAV
jgi:hypothetical protein